MTARAQAALSRGCQLVIFPEGTRRAPGATPDYKPGVAYLYGKTNVPCVPIALNSGMHWPRRSLLRPPGTIIAEILDPIPTGAHQSDVYRQLQDAIETATARLIRRIIDLMRGP